MMDGEEHVFVPQRAFNIALVVEYRVVYLEARGSIYDYP